MYIYIYYIYIHIYIHIYVYRVLTFIRSKKAFSGNTINPV